MLASQLLRGCLTGCLLVMMTGCALFKSAEPGIGKAMAWDKVPHWQQDQQQRAWPALLQSCKKTAKRPHWDKICAQAGGMPAPEDAESARRFFQQWFQPHQIRGSGGSKKGLITGYYEPLLFGSYEKTDRYRYPLYGRPDSLLIIDLGERFPDLKNARLRGRVIGNKVIPYFSRADIEADRSLLEGNELLWLDDQNAVFFLHIQGSGRVQLPSGKVVGVGYSDQNGHPYKAIGKVLVDQEQLKLEEVSLFSIKRWLEQNPDQAEQVLNANPSYIFFVLRDDPGSGPIGSLNVPLTGGRSLAIDPRLIKLGAPVWLITHYPGDPEQPLHRLVMAQDTGGAIKGNVRADLFWGNGDVAEQAAGTMKSKGEMIVLLPRSDPEI